jgi:tetratricopeptide (TPR) repeat protein
MTELGFLTRIDAMWPRGERQYSSSHVLRLAERAVRQYPKSARLLIALGELIEVSRESDYRGFDPLKLYLRATQCEPDYWEGYEAAGFYYFVHNDYGNKKSLKKAEVMFRKAIRVGAGHDSFLGLGGALLEQGKLALARGALQKCTRRADPWLKDLLSELSESKPPRMLSKHAAPKKERSNGG